MSPCMIKYCTFSLQSLLVLAVFSLAFSHSADNHCGSPLVSTCKECLRRGPECAWCFQKRFLDGAHISQRCDTAARLILKGCGEKFLENPGIKVEVNATQSSLQVAPKEIAIQLRPGSKVSFIVEVQQLELYPVDLYYLVDVSASMQDNLDRLKNIGVSLSHRMREYSTDFRVGFGSFVDKPVSPYIDVHPSKIVNPCSDYEVNCRPAHGFTHVLPVTENMTEFKRVIQQQRISGNMDTPEGGFDAMLQAAVCQMDIGWRPEAKHLLLIMTDQPSHLALDSKLAGIVVPHDGRCHLEDGTYSQSANMEHPTIAQLAEKLLENNIYSIFAVDYMQYKWYEELMNFIPGSYLGQLLPKAPNLVNLVVDAYRKLLSDVEVEVGVKDSEASRFWVNVSAICPNGSTAAGNARCANVQPGQKVFFNITVGMRTCPVEELQKEGKPEILMMVKPVGFNESVTVRIQQACGCHCGETEHCHDDPEPYCVPRANLMSDKTFIDSCRDERSGLVCSGRGTCMCGACMCDHSNLGSVYGRFCEKDDFSCPYDGGLVCGGHGQCVSGKCTCQAGWTGESCGCPVSPESCMSADGLVCSGNGQCVCGKCVCDDQQHSEKFCEKCPTCSNSCQSHWSCVDCHLSKGLELESTQQCNSSCKSLVVYVDEITVLIKGKYCLYHRIDQCIIRFHVDLDTLQISRRAECLSILRHFKTFLSIFLLTVVLGLGILAVVRLLLRGKNCSWKEMSNKTDSDSKVMSYAPTANEKTITYRRDRLPEHPMEMHVHIPKMPLHDIFP